MIKSNIAREYPNHIAKYDHSDESLYLADYTDQTNSKRGTEVVKGSPPSDIEYVTFQNDIRLSNGFIIFNNKSFKRGDGTPLPQCELVIFPEKSGNDSWIFFAELKYSVKAENNSNNLYIAAKQLFETRKYYYRKRIFLKTNPCYLLISFPKQKLPFANFINPEEIAKFKRKYNIVLRIGNNVEVLNDKMLILR